MSRRALRLAVRNLLRDTAANGGLDLTQRECDVTGPNGKPPPRCGERFVAVHGGGETNNSRDDLDETYHVFVTVTMRAAKVPFDRWGPDLIDKATSGMDALCGQIKVAVHKDTADDRGIRRANIILGADPDGFGSINGFVESLFFQDAGDDREVGPDWFNADPEDAGSYGLTRTLRFGGARKIQTLESMV